MEYYFFIIIVIIVLKVLFWTFYFYVRAQRIRQLQNARGRVIIVETRPVARRPLGYNDRSAIINHAEPVSVTGPPPYSEVVKDGETPLPPPYSQAVAAPLPSYPVPSSNGGAPAAVYSGPVSSPGGGCPQQFVGHPSQAQSFSPPLHAVPSQNPPVPMQNTVPAQTPSAPHQ